MEAKSGAHLLIEIISLPSKPTNLLESRKVILANILDVILILREETEGNGRGRVVVARWAM